MKKSELSVDRVAEFRAKYKEEKQQKSSSNSQSDFIKSARVALIIIFLFLMIFAWEQAVSFYMNIIRNSDTHFAVVLINFFFALLITALCVNEIMIFNSKK